MKRIRNLLKYRKRKAMWIKLVLLPKERVQSFKNKMRKLVLKIIGYPLSSLLLVGLALRLFLAPFTSQPNDTIVWYVVSNDLLAGLGIYTTKSFTYPPLWAYILYPMVNSASFFIDPSLFGTGIHDLILSVENWTPPIITSPLFNLLFKIPLIVADTLIGIMIYNLVKELRTERLARLCLIFWFFNPLVVWIDSVHGQFDVLPALMTILSFGFFYKRNYLASGIAISVGALFKIYPVYLAPLYLFSVASLEGNSSPSTLENIRKTFIGCLKFVSGLLSPLTIFLFPLINSNFFHAVFARTNVITSAGGLTLFNIVYCPGLEWLFPWIVNNSVMVSGFLVAVGIGTSTSIGFLCFLSGRRSFLKTFVLGHITVLTVVYLTSLTVNPQYIIWILPFLILSYGLYQHYLVRLTTLSIFSLMLLIGLHGPLFFFYPTAVFTPFLDSTIVSSYAGFPDTAIAVAIVFFSGMSGAVIFLSLFGGTVKSLLKLQNTPRTPYVPQQRDKKKSQPPKSTWNMITSIRVLALTFIVLIVGQVMVYTQPMMRKNVVLNVDNYVFNGDDFRMQYMIESGSYPANVQIVGMPLTTAPVYKDVFIYYDKDYPSSFVGKASWIGFWDHATIELQLRGYSGSIERVDATELRYVMQENNNSIVIIPSGVFPDTVHTKNETLVGNWLQSGGTLVWMGDVFAYYSGHEEKEVNPISEDNPGWEGQTRILGFSLFNETTKETEIFADINSSFSDALDLQYPNAFVGTSISELRKHGGLALGRITSSEKARTSIAYVPVGNGHLILFGGGIGRVFTLTGEDVIAKDVARILCSGFLFSTGDITFKTHELERNEEKEGVLNLTLSNDGESSKGVIIIAFSKVPYVRFFSRHTLFRD